MDESASHPEPAPGLPLSDGVPGPERDVEGAPARDPRARFNLKGRSLREHTARGTLINTAFMVALSLLALAKGFILAAFLTREDYGLFGVLAVSLGTLLWLKQVGIGDKFIQQDDDDQEAAFQKAFTLELLSTLIAVVLLSAALPLVCIAYGEWDLLLPGLVIVVLVLPVGVLRAPVWVFYRQMEFFKQRLLQAVEPIVGFAVAIGLAIAGYGYWALIIGMLAGAWAAAAVAVWASPFKLKYRYDGSTVRSYWSFSWPLLLTTGSGMILAQAAVFTTEAHLGLAGAGAVALASNITQLTNRVDGLITSTLYPAICAVKDRVDLLYESFVKSNRLALMWAMPFGVGLALFCGDLVTFVIGEEWRPSVELLQIYGYIAAIGHVGFNWDAYFRARGDTKPMAVAGIASMVTFLVAGIPLLLTYDLRGLAVGVALQAAAHVGVRAFYLRRLFDGFKFLTHALRAMVPTVPALIAVVVLREAAPFERTLAVALAELAIFIAVAIGVTWLLERKLLREMVGYLTVRPTAGVPA